MALLKRRKWLLIAVLAVGLVLALVFGGRAAWRLVHRLTGPPPVPRQTDVSQIAGWMNVPYVGRAYRVPPQVLADALGIPENERDGSSFDTIATRSGRTTDEVLAIVRTTVTDWQQTRPPPKPELGAPKPELEAPKPGGGVPKPEPGAPKPELDAPKPGPASP